VRARQTARACTKKCEGMAFCKNFISNCLPPAIIFLLNIPYKRIRKLN